MKLVRSQTDRQCHEFYTEFLDGRVGSEFARDFEGSSFACSIKGGRMLK
jgi:hypothetical protein